MHGSSEKTLTSSQSPEKYPTFAVDPAAAGDKVIVDPAAADHQLAIDPAPSVGDGSRRNKRHHEAGRNAVDPGPPALATRGRRVKKRRQIAALQRHVQWLWVNLEARRRLEADKPELQAKIAAKIEEVGNEFADL